jgi:hypothetical protein
MVVRSMIGKSWGQGSTARVTSLFMNVPGFADDPMTRKAASSLRRQSRHYVGPIHQKGSGEAVYTLRRAKRGHGSRDVSRSWVSRIQLECLRAALPRVSAFTLR